MHPHEVEQCLALRIGKVAFYFFDVFGSNCCPTLYNRKASMARGRCVHPRRRIAGILEKRQICKTLSPTAEGACLGWKGMVDAGFLRKRGHGRWGTRRF
jgi:hypothetical protein